MKPKAKRKPSRIHTRRVYVFGQKRPQAPKPRPPAPESQGKPTLWTSEVFQVVREVEAAMRENAITAFLRRLPYEEWNRLIDALPRCWCGRVVAPIRAKYVHTPGMHAYCSVECMRVVTWRRHRRRKSKRYKDQRAEREAMAAALSQG
jgi:hypothetical protein